MFGMKNRKKRSAARMRARAMRAKAARGPGGGTAAAYESALDLTPVEQATKRKARMRALQRRRVMGGRS